MTGPALQALFQAQARGHAVDATVVEQALAAKALGVQIDRTHVVVDEYCRTGVEGLYAIGECACVSVHGANRLGTNSLLDLYFNPIHKAEHGEPGRNKDRYGRCGKDLRVKVPCGSGSWLSGRPPVIGNRTGKPPRTDCAGSRNRASSRYTSSRPSQRHPLIRPPRSGTRRRRSPLPGSLNSQWG